MTPVAVLLWAIAALLGTAVTAVALSRAAVATQLVYSACAVICGAALLFLLVHLVGQPGSTTSLSLPLGLPWLGAHFRLDPLATFFLIVVDLGGAAASVYGLAYGRHETAPHRVLPFFAAFLAGMNLVVLADDAFTFLVSWEFMSLSSWALVMAHHRD